MFVEVNKQNVLEKNSSFFFLSGFNSKDVGSEIYIKPEGFILSCLFFLCNELTLNIYDINYRNALINLFKLNAHKKLFQRFSI